MLLLLFFNLFFALFLFLFISHYYKNLSMDPVHESGPWTWSKVGVHGPLVHVLSSPLILRGRGFAFPFHFVQDLEFAGEFATYRPDMTDRTQHSLGSTVSLAWSATFHSTQSRCEHVLLHRASILVFKNHVIHGAAHFYCPFRTDFF